MKEMFKVSDTILGFLLFQWILPICRATTFPECSMRIPHGNVSWWCKQYGTPCTYSCDEGYESNKSPNRVSFLQCSTSGQLIPWPSNSVYGDNFSVKDLCTAKPCSTMISQGTLAVGCKAVVGSKCNFSCDLGYVRNISVSEITCQTSTEWNTDMRRLCIRPDGQQCPYEIAKGHLKHGCIREPGHSCTFECIEGYNTSLSPSVITCESNLKWNLDLRTLCQGCDMQIPHGQVTWYCKKYGIPCSYSCDEGYKGHDRVSWLQCSTSGQWIPLSSDSVYDDNFSVENLCTAKPCSTVISHGTLAVGCKAVVGSKCNFSCDLGYVRNISVSEITCQTSTEWNPDVRSLCIAKPCSTVISQGTLAAECKAAVGSKCNFSCDLGYVRNISVSEITCQTSTEWYRDVRSLCIRPDGQQCPYEIANGHLKHACIREPGHSCTFECIEGYNTSLSPSIITCGSNLKWNHVLTTLCKVPECDMQIPHGHVTWWCKKQYTPPCSYSCDEGYKSHDRVSWLQCSTSGQWIPWPSSSVYGDNVSVENLCTAYPVKLSTENYDRILTESRPASGGLIAGITTSVVIVIFIIAAIVVLKLKRSSVRKSSRNASVHSGGMPWRPRDNPLQNATTIREYNHVDGIGSTSFFESPSYNGICAQSFVQRISAISSNWSYREPPPSYSETQNAANESPPTYNDVVMDPTRFNLYT